jgi:hypothetical protein
MNDTPPPLDPDRVDELLSADLDGAFDEAATDLGLDPATARRRLAATPGVAARRAALDSARAALGDVPDLDELTAARLRAAAVGSARMRRGRGRAYAVAGGVAAALAVATGIGVVLGDTGERADDRVSAAAPSDAAAPRPTAAAEKPASGNDFGDAPDAAHLANVVRARLGATADAGAPALTEGMSTSGYDGAARRDLRTPSRCDASAASGGGTLVLAGTARLAGEPVVLYVLRAGGTDVMTVVAASDCRPVARQELAPRG